MKSSRSFFVSNGIIESGIVLKMSLMFCADSVLAVVSARAMYRMNLLM